MENNELLHVEEGISRNLTLKLSSWIHNNLVYLAEANARIWTTESMRLW